MNLSPKSDDTFIFIFPFVWVRVDFQKFIVLLYCIYFFSIEIIFCKFPPLFEKSGAKTLIKNKLFCLCVAGKLFKKSWRKLSSLLKKAGQKLEISIVIFRSRAKHLKSNGIDNKLDFKAAPAKEVGGGGGENTDLSRRESRYLDCEAKRSKTNLWLF